MCPYLFLFIHVGCVCGMCFEFLLKQHHDFFGDVGSQRAFTFTGLKITYAPCESTAPTTLCRGVMCDVPVLFIMPTDDSFYVMR